MVPVNVKFKANAGKTANEMEGLNYTPTWWNVLKILLISWSAFAYILKGRKNILFTWKFEVKKIHAIQVIIFDIHKISRKLNSTVF